MGESWPLYTLADLKRALPHHSTFLDDQPGFPAHDGDPLRPVYAMVETLVRDARALAGDWATNPARVPAGASLLKHKPRHDAFMAVMRCCAWLLLGRDELAHGRASVMGWVRAHHMVQSTADQIARGDPGLTDGDVRELISYSALATARSSGWFPKRALIAALDFYSRHRVLPVETGPVLDALVSELTSRHPGGLAGWVARLAQVRARVAGSAPPSADSGFDAEEFIRSAPLESIAVVDADRFDQVLRAYCDRLRAVAEGIRSKTGQRAGDMGWWNLLWNVPEWRRTVAIAEVLLAHGHAFTDREWEQLLVAVGRFGALNCHDHSYLPNLVARLEREVQPRADDRAILEPAAYAVAEALAASGRADENRLARRLLAAVIVPPDLAVEPGEQWTDCVATDLDSLGPENRALWLRALKLCREARSASPSRRWSKDASGLLESIGVAAFSTHVLRWFPLVDRPRTERLVADWRWQHSNAEYYISEPNQAVLKGLCWIAGMIRDADLTRALTKLALSAYRKLPGIGPRAVSVGNAAVYALGQMPGMDAVGQLAMLRVKVKFGTAQKVIDKALAAAAAREGLPREEIDELGVPGYGLTEVGRRMEAMGDYTAELVAGGVGDVELRFSKNAAVGKPAKVAKSVPAAVKSGHGEELKELKAAAKDIAAMLTAQRDRLDSLFLENKTWPYGLWRERYLDHPLVGVLARRLIWRLAPPEGPSATWLDGALVGPDGKPVALVDASTAVRLWHPIEAGRDEVMAWRRFFEDRQIRQPFKQAHREVYLLTDAERTTETYSNRFAAHILKQHQFHALAAARNWKNKLRLNVDAEYPPATRVLPAWGLRAEYWVEGAGDEQNDAGAWLYLSSDQVRFYRIGTAQAMAHAGGGGYGPAWNIATLATAMRLEEIPPLVLSEVMRDVDLFVGVASVGNNPQWHDGGPTGAYQNYWWNYSFGELTESGAGRKELLARLVPRLAIAPACSLDGKFLVVKGKLRTYKIHLGSGNILMEPNDQYLCIVPSGRGESGTATAGVFLPFEGDRTLSIILSKAMMLAEDDTITDASITRQIGGR